MEKEIYFQHTDPICHQCRIGERATIACKKVGDTIQYGISICSVDDNFSREKGREIAIERLNKGFGITKFNNGYFDQMESSHKALIAFMRVFAKSFDSNRRKYKDRIEKFNKNS